MSISAQRAYASTRPVSILVSEDRRPSEASERRRMIAFAAQRALSLRRGHGENPRQPRERRSDRSC